MFFVKELWRKLKAQMAKYIQRQVTPNALVEKKIDEGGIELILKLHIEALIYHIVDEEVVKNQ